MTVVLILRPIAVDPARRDDEPDATAEPETEYRYPLGAGLPRKAYPYRTASKEN